MAVKAVKEREFQSTLPRGERPNADIDASRKGIFQSTLPRGERQENKKFVTLTKISIHAPARGATF